jgi:uncharacterized protein (TIGR02246 family)
MDDGAIKTWMDGYVAAWESNDPAAIGDLFSEDARYFTAPYREPWTGRDAIVAGWIGRGDDLGTWTFDWHTLAVAGDLAFVQGRTTYTTPPNYRNLWVIRFDAESRAVEFTEWFMEER